MKEFSKHVGLDVHKVSIEVGIADSASRLKARHYGAVAHTESAVDTMLKKLNPEGHIRCLST